MIMIMDALSDDVLGVNNPFQHGNGGDMLGIENRK